VRRFRLFFLQIAFGTSESLLLAELEMCSVTRKPLSCHSFPTLDSVWPLYRVLRETLLRKVPSAAGVSGWQSRQF
jgi:hypothetical protein